MKNANEFYNYLKSGMWLTGSWKVTLKKKWAYISLCFIERTKTVKVLKEKLFNDGTIAQIEETNFYPGIFSLLEYRYFNK